MMNKAGRVLGIRWLTSLTVLLAIGLAIQQYVATIRHRYLVENGKNTVASMGTSRGLLVPRAIADLRELPERVVVRELKEQYENSKSLEKLSLAYALAEYGEGDVEFLLSSIANAPSIECANLVTALKHDQELAVERLKELAREADAKQDWKRKGRLAVLALHLNDATIAIDMHADRLDPTQQTVFIHDVFPVWHANLVELAEFIRRVENAPLRAGMCLAIGNLQEEKLGDAKAGWTELLSEWFLQLPDSGTHSAAGWALRRWDIQVPGIRANTNDPIQRDWKVTSMGEKHGFTMIRIPAGEYRRPYSQTALVTTLTKDLWLSDVEVSVELFELFMGDNRYDTEHPDLAPAKWAGTATDVSPTARHPAQVVSWEDAVLFCNWMSLREGRRPCYKVQPIAERDSQLNYTLQVTLLPNGNGYRLPTEAEWEYACRAGTNTTFCFGDKAELLRNYGAFDDVQASPTGSKMCNRWGLFDMHGNVFEWCFDWYGPYQGVQAENPIGAKSGERRTDRGGGWRSTARSCRSALRDSDEPTYRSGSLGFRLALETLDNGSKTRDLVSGRDGNGT